MRPITLYIISCLIALMVPFIDYQKGPPLPSDAAFPGWPARLQNCELQEMPPTKGEAAFEKDFPGRIGRFRMCENLVSIRWIYSGSRKVHPVSQCYQGSGYSIKPLPLWVDEEGVQWGCFSAIRGSEVIIVKEKIADEKGTAWSDVSSWYWAALLGKTTGPWWAYAIATRVKE